MSTRRNRATLFTITDEHVALLRRMWVDWQDCEYGAPEINPKRPYGNSSVALDIAEILGWQVDEDEGLTEAQEERAATIHRETQVVLQILLRCGEIPIGTFARPDEWGNNWQRVEESA